MASNGIDSATQPAVRLASLRHDKSEAPNADNVINVEHDEEGSMKHVDADSTPVSARDHAFAELGIPNWEELEKKVVRRLDMTLLPTLWLLYVFNYLDRASLGQARLSTLDEDLQLVGSQFGSAVSILSAGYVLGQVPSNMIIGKSAESVPSRWYTRREIAVRIAIMSTGVSLANGLSGLIAAAVFTTLEGARGVAGWQWLFIVLALFGAMWTMTEDMRKVAQIRIIADRVSEVEIQSTIWTGVKLTVIDYKFWLLTGVNIAISTAYGFSNFYPAIVRGLGYDRITALLLTFPPYCVAAATSIAVAWNSDRVGERGWHFSTPIAVGLAGYVICMITTATVPRYSASYLFIRGLFGANPLIQTWLSTTLARTPEKKAVSVALCNVLSQIGNVIAPFFSLTPMSLDTAWHLSSCFSWVVFVSSLL
ncbi:hypothetical protein FPOA_09386 [Fusarium poae]|uniref:Major facilitator superfamily (MFS) profile domain-containing protein n=1 Tax=Fusarium poae TaxID=36050 RepID=A0A1B8AAZ5_FUSPO|nr:hypothetical protein FPOA_09386 [Fusarium poae]